MDIEWKESILDQLIKENPEATVHDFTELLGEIEGLRSEVKEYYDSKELNTCLKTEKSKYA